MPIHLPFHLPRIPDFLKRPLDPTQTLEAFEHYAEKAIDFATKHGGEIGRNIMDDLVDAAAPYAAALDIGVDALLPGINLYYGEKWASGRGRKDPFKQKGGVVRSKSSQSPAQRMPTGKRPRDPSDAYERELKRRLDDFARHKSIGMSYRGNISLAKRGRLSKKRKPKSKFLGVTRNYDDHGTVSRNHAAYFCAQSHGSHNRLFEILGEAIAKRCLADIKVYPASYDEPLAVNSGSNEYYPHLYVKYRRVNDNGSVDDLAGDGISTYQSAAPAGPITFRQFAADVTTQIQDNADATGGNGYVPFTYRWVMVSLSGVESVSGFDFEIRSLATGKINIIVKQVIRLQNVTPNDSGGLDTAQADRNPISGKVYTAGDHIPRVREPLLTTGVHPEYDEFQRQSSATGVWGGPDLGADSPIAHPPPAKHLFSNIKAVQSASMSAGGTMTKTTYWKFSGTLKHLIERIYKSNYKKGNFGECVVFGFEQTHRTSGAQSVTLAVNREVHMKATISIKKKIPMLQEYDNTPVNFAA